MALMEISVVPLGTGSTSLGHYVAEIKDYLAKKGVPHTLTDMGTIIEGEVEELLALARELHEMPFKAGAQRSIPTSALTIGGTERLTWAKKCRGFLGE